MTKMRFSLDGREVMAQNGDTIWAVAKREGVTLPHLCHLDAPGYRPDGNCRACLVEVEGERVLSPSCWRKPTPGMVVRTQSARAKKARHLVIEMLLADQPARASSPDGQSALWRWSDALGLKGSRFAKGGVQEASSQAPRLAHDASHGAIAVNLDACIACGLCARACREVQVNDVIGMGGRGASTFPRFDLGDPMGASTCVGCGECVQACPTGALFEKGLMESTARRRTIQTFDKEVDSLCPYCGVGCLTKVRVSNGRIVQVDGRAGPANLGRLCIKGRFGFDYIHSASRLVHPLVRREGVPKDAALDPSRFDRDQVFRRASWDEALDRAAEGFKTILASDGGSALAGFGSAKGSNEEAYLFQKLIRQGFGVNNVDHCTRLCHASSVAALMESLSSGAVSAPFTDALKADCIIVIGARPTVNHPVAATYFKQAAKAGKTLIVVDPRGQDLMRHAHYGLRIRPGTDVAFLNALLHTLFDENLINHDFLRRRVDNVDALRAKVADFSPESMATVCGVDAAVLREVARIYAGSERSIIFWGMGISQHCHGTDNARCLIALALVTGQIGRPGTGLHPLRGQNNVQGASDAGLIPHVFPDYQSVEKASVREGFEDLWGRKLDAVRGLTVVEIVDQAAQGIIKGLYVMGENPAMSDPDQSHARHGLAKLDHLVVQDLFLTETACFADVILPSSAHAEKWGSYTNSNRQVQLGRPAVSPPGEARQDLDLIMALADRLGCGWSYGGIADVFSEMVSVMPSLEGITWQRLLEEDSVTYPLSSATGVGEPVLFGETFPTDTGRARIFPADLLPPDDAPDETFPMILTTGRVLEHWHTGAMTRRSSLLDDLEPTAFAAMNGREIARLGLSAGQMIEVKTRRGSVRALLRRDFEVADGMIFMPFCYHEAAANWMTSAKLDPFGKIPAFKFSAAQVAASLPQTDAKS